MYELSTKPDFDKTIARFEAWWVGEITDRLPVNINTREKKHTTIAAPVSHHTNFRDRWMDVEYQVECALAWAQETNFLGDSFPVWSPNVGPDLTTTLFNADLEFSEGTSWVHKMVLNTEDWEPYLDMPLNFDNPYWQTIEQMTRLGIERSDHRLLIAQPDLHNSYDILVGLRSPTDLCRDLYDIPDTIKRMAQRGVEALVKSALRSFELIEGTGMGSSTWLPYYHQGPAYVPSCDFLALVSKTMGDQFIMPTIRQEMEPLERSIFHLDGPTALQHLDSLLDMPDLNAIQWVYGAGNGDADDWIHIYEKCLRHGKSLQVICETQQAAINTLKALGPRGVWLCVYEAFDTVEEGSRFIKLLEQIALETPSLYRPQTTKS